MEEKPLPPPPEARIEPGESTPRVIQDVLAGILRKIEAERQRQAGSSQELPAAAAPPDEGEDERAARASYRAEEAGASGRRPMMSPQQAATCR